MNEAVGNVQGITNWETTEEPNAKPVISLPGSFSVNAGDSLVISASATDSDGDALTYSWAIDSALQATGTSSNTVTVIGADVTVDTEYALLLTVSDGKGSTTRSTKVTVIADVVDENNAPVLSAIANIDMSELQTVSVVASATDADADALTYTWNVPAGLTLVGSGANVSLTSGDVSADTTYSVSVTVSDGEATATQSFEVTVVDELIVLPNSAPVVQAIANVSIEENTSTSVNVSATDDFSTELAYTWSVPAGLTLQGSGSNVTLTAGEVSTDTSYTVSVSVSDGDKATSTSFTVTVTDSAVIIEPTGSWDATTIYLGGETVTYNGKSYTAKWWTQNNAPSDGGPWGENFVDDGTTAGWSASRIYNGGDQVSFNGDTYQAQWWTQGNMPGTNDVWVKL